MNEYEIASLAAREAALWVAVAQVAATLVIGIGQIAIVWYGIRAMVRANDERALQQREALKQQRDADDKRHAEAMQRLDATRDADDKRHAETMQRLDAARDDRDKRHAETMQRLAAARDDDDKRHAEAMRALEVLIERTAPGPQA